MYPVTVKILLKVQVCKILFCGITCKDKSDILVADWV